MKCFDHNFDQFDQGEIEPSQVKFLTNKNRDIHRRDSMDLSTRISFRQ